MTRRTSLMEWLDQTKKLAKSKDMVSLDVVDGVIDVLPYLDPKMILRHKVFFDDICDRYHKDNPLDMLRIEPDAGFKDSHKMPFKTWRKQNLKRVSSCLGGKGLDKCPLTDTIVRDLNKFVEGSIGRAETAQKDILWQWFEVVDFMFERPELINPELIDEYVNERIFTICKKHKKNNPLANGMRARFGKWWKDDTGHWRKERRKRF